MAYRRRREATASTPASADRPYQGLPACPCLIPARGTSISTPGPTPPRKYATTTGRPARRAKPNLRLRHQIELGRFRHARSGRHSHVHPNGFVIGIESYDKDQMAILRLPDSPTDDDKATPADDRHGRARNSCGDRSVPAITADGRIPGAGNAGRISGVQSTFRGTLSRGALPAGGFSICPRTGERPQRQDRLALELFWSAPTGCAGGAQSGSRRIRQTDTCSCQW